MDITVLTSIIYLTIGVLLALLGILIFRENPTQRTNRAAAVMLILAALAPIMGAFGLLINKMNAQLRLDLQLFQRIFLIWEFFFPQLLYFSLIFPREQKYLKDYPRIVYFLYLPHVFHFLVILFFRGPESIMSLSDLSRFGSQISSLLQPLAIFINLMLSALSLFYEFHINFFALINLIYVIAAIIIMYKGYNELTSPRMKKQVGLVLWGIRASVGLYAVAFLLPKLFPLKTTDTVIYFLTILALLIGAGSIAWAIIKYQFLDISQSISRNFLFSICSGFVFGTLLVLFDQSKKLLTSLVGFQIPILEVLFIILAVILIQPTFSGIRLIIDKLFGRDSSDYRYVLQSLSHDILTIMDIETLKDKIASTLTESMMLENVHLIIENKAGDFEVTCEKEGKIHHYKFSRQGEFIALMRKTEKPVGYEEIVTHISASHETELLNKLNCYMLLPLSHRGDLNGVLCLGNKLTRTSFSAEDAALLNGLSDQIAIALENIELYEEKLERQHFQKEIAVARDIQKMLLPYHIPRGKNFEISAMNIPSKEVGGDYYDFIQLDERHVGIAIGDISGKGIPGAMLMSNLQATLRASVWQSHQPAEVMRKINNQISNTTSSEKFATFFYGILDSKKLTFTFTNAGHNYPILKKGKGEYCFLTSGGLVIGVKPDYEYEQTRVQLHHGDTLVFYTDGITEALNSDIEEFGEQKLIDIVIRFPYQTAEELRNHIYNEMISFTRGESQYDDITLIVLQIL